MTTKKNLDRILSVFNDIYKDDLPVTLDHVNAWELLVATILSAQCTDARVNMVTPGLFKKYPDPQSMAKASQSDLEKLIHSVGFYHSKSKNLINCARMICERFDGQVPSDMESLTSLPGVGRKTANVILGNIYNIPGIVVDTHVKRISKKLGLTKNTDPEKVEYDLMKVLPKEYWIKWNLWLINFGRSTCTAPRPKCDGCPLASLCPSAPR